MTRTSDTERLIRAYLDEGLNELPDRVYEVVRSDIDRTRQRVVIGPWRTPDMNTFAKLAMAAAAVVVVALVGYNLLPGRGGVGGAPASPPPSASTSPSSSASGAIGGGPSDAVPAGALKPGTYTKYRIDGTGINVRFTVPSGWTWVDEWILSPIGAANDDPAIGFWTGDIQVYRDPCKWRGTEPDPPTGSTARDLVDDLAALPARNASAPVERKAAGPGGAQLFQWPGWSIQLTVPQDADFSKCDDGQFRTWGPERNARYHQGPGQRDVIWAIDADPSSGADGRVVIVVGSFPGAPAKTMADIDAILASMEFSSGT
jgi:hypothetical protein